MSGTIKLDVIKVVQPIGTIYVAKISPNVLLEMSKVDRRRIEDDDEVLGVQRELRRDKVIQINKYLSSVDATFPNSIIVNTTSACIVNESETELEIKTNEDAFTIIDGQHRVEGFRDIEVKNFELIVAIFKDLKIDQQANIFSTINSQQTKVDPSLNLHLEINNKVYTPKKMMIEVAQSFCLDPKSPWFNEIRILGRQTSGIISLSAFVKPLLNLTYPEQDYHLIRNRLMESKDADLGEFKYDMKRYLFWTFYLRKDQESVFKILLNYFEALALILDKDWLNQKSLLNKTTGYNAIIKLFKDYAEIGVKEKKLTYEFFFEKLKGLSVMNGTINSSNFGASGSKASNELYYEMKKTLTNKN
ncbi:DGQHR domain-containing protein [uncultured Dokdonia sp.]|uniref:DGQHR domain-containing protein n=1 Tax=uncultured Dokdonia sp. TaxID=575653 RepID=UPI00261119C5|nr:DGQHR domain-containing protein [uncultured Dokdonia sp.]